VTDAERYLERASQLEEVARTSFRSDFRRELLSLAQDWRDLAEQVTRIEQRSFKSSLSRPHA
jgi:hypothetical protein